MKNLLAPLAFVLVVFLASCGGKAEEAGKQDMNNAASTVVDSAAVMDVEESASEIEEDKEELDSLLNEL